MKKMKTLTVTLVVALLSTLGLQASKETGNGQVQLPLEIYTNLVQQATDPTRPPRPAPAGYVLGSAGVSVTVHDFEERASSAIQVQLGIDVLEDEWVLIPVLPAGTPVERNLM